MKLDAEIKNFLRCTAAKAPNADIADWEECIADNDFLLILDVASQCGTHIPAALLKGVKLAFCTAIEDALEQLGNSNFSKKDVYDVLKLYRDIVQGLYKSRKINASVYCDILDIYAQNVDFVKNWR